MPRGKKQNKTGSASMAREATDKINQGTTKEK